jgi:predicted transcriptional regulator
MLSPAAKRSPERAAVLTKAVRRAAEILDFSQKELARVLGVSAATVSRIGAGSRMLDPTTKEGELALLFLRVFRSLDALVGGNEEKARRWFHAHNVHLEGKPAAKVTSVAGLVHVAEYLDGMRGKL